MHLLNLKYARAVLLLLLLQAAAYYALAFRAEAVPPVPPLITFPERLGSWQMTKDTPVEKEVLDVLRADDTLNREYLNPVRGDSYLWIAYFKTQRYGQSPHSPKNCLPGSGWEPVPGASGPLTVHVTGWDAPITINRYVVQHGDDRSVSLYWYQSHGRVIAGEMAAKFWLVTDSIRYRRSDTALIRVTVPVRDSIEQAVSTGVDFVQAVFPAVMRQLPL
jgi:EpsI family protein